MQTEDINFSNTLWGKEYNNIRPVQTINRPKVRIEEWKVYGRTFLRKSPQGKITDYHWLSIPGHKPAYIKILENKRQEYIEWHRQKQIEMIEVKK